MVAGFSQQQKANTDYSWPCNSYVQKKANDVVACRCGNNVAANPEKRQFFSSAGRGTELLSRNQRQIMPLTDKIKLLRNTIAAA